MKQIDICLDRAFENKSPLKTKWKAIIEKDNVSNINKLTLFHYQHIILIYDLENKKILSQWYECPTDKRGLNAALKYLEHNNLYLI